MMKKNLVLIVFFVAWSQYGMAQTKPVAYYIHLVASSTNGALVGSPEIVTAELASPLDSLIDSKQTEALLRKGNILDALNYFSLKGWELISTHCVPYGSKGDVDALCYYLL